MITRIVEITLPVVVRISILKIASGKKHISVDMISISQLVYVRKEINSCIVGGKLRDNDANGQNSSSNP